MPQHTARTARAATAAALDELERAIERHLGVKQSDWPPQLTQTLIRALHECYRRGANDVHERLTVKPPPPWEEP